MRSTRDDDLAAAVRHALLDDQAVPDAAIDVAAADGRVTLDGAVELSAERDEAGRVARRVDGVREVENRLAVWPPDLQSELVRRTVESAIAAGETDRGPNEKPDEVTP